MTRIMERFGLEEGQELEHPWLNRSVETAQKRVEERNYLARKHTLEYDDVMNKQREVVYGYRREAIESDEPRKMIFEVIDEAVPPKITEYLEPLEDAEPNYTALLQWINTTFPLGLTMEKAGFDKMTIEEASNFLIDKIKTSYEFKVSHEETTAVRGLERYIILNAIDRLWQEHLYAMDSLREGVSLRRYGQKDPLIEYKNEAYEMFVELMGNIKTEILNNLFRSTSNLMAFEQFLANLPHHLLHEEIPAPAGKGAGMKLSRVAVGAGGLETELEPELELPIRRELPKVGRNEPCPCGSGKKFKNCCGRLA
jgi:preprotein translocase subunit SecA